MFIHPGIDPFVIPIATAWDEDGQATAFDERVHYNVTAAFLATHPTLETYRVAPSPLARVFAGDDANDPQWTVALRFDDEAALLASPLGAYWVDPA